MKKYFSFVLVGLGGVIAAFFLLADLMGLGKAGIQSAQILGIEIGALFVLAGFVVRTLQARDDFSAGRMFVFFRDLPALAWVILGMLPAFVWFLIAPMFFDPTLRIQYPADYIRQIVPIGIDFQTLLRVISIWLQGDVNPQVVFAPLINILFAPLLLIEYPTSYYILTLVTLTSYLLISLLAVLMVDAKQKALAVFIAAVSIFSYGLVFELERGQTYTLSFSFCLLAIYLFHWQRDLRWLAYLLFSIAVQMKYYPALFVLLLVDDWRNWKTNLIRFAGLGLASFLLLFIFGFSYFSVFWQHTIGGIETGEYAVANHSIQSFVAMLSSTEWNLLKGESARWVAQNSGLVSGLLYFYFFICFAAVLVGAWLRNESGFNPDLLMVCVIGSLTLPSVNHDYTLPLLTAPFALVVASWYARINSPRKPLTIFLTLLASFAYAAILFPHIFKPLFLGNSLPMIFIILTATTLQSVAQPVTSKTG